MGCKPRNVLPGHEVLPDRRSVRWPHEARLAVLLTFDCYGGDAVDGLQIVRTTLDFGPKRGVGRILELLDKLNIRATFNFAGTSAEAFPQAVHAVLQAGHEVAALGYRYAPPGQLTEAEERKCIQQAIASLHRVTGQRPRGWRTPESRPSVHTLALLAEAGFAWDSSLRNDDLPYVKETACGPLLEIPFGGANDDMYYFGFPNPVVPAASVLSVWQDELAVIYQEAQRQCSMFILCLHPSFVGRPAELSALEQLLTKTRQLDGVWFARCQDMAAWWAQNRNWAQTERSHV